MHFLSSFKVKHSILNAKNHAREADIVAQAGSRSAVTVATNMAGRGTDILLGGNPEFLTRKAGFHPEDENYQENLEKFIKKCEEERENILNKGGLHIIGTERHESRRIDNQLRGRAGRQGDPGFSRFYLSLEDDLLRLFGSDRIKGLMERLGMEDGEPIYHSMVTKSVANAQTRVEGRNFESRKHVLEYDDVMDQQRKTIYGLRRTILEESTDMSQTYAQDGTPPDLWDIEGMESSFTHYYMQASDIPSSEVGSNKDLAELLYKKSEDIMRIKYNELGEENFSQISRYVYLSGIDHLWKEHLKTMDHLKQGIGLRGYGQKKPSQEYKKEGFELFRQLMQDITNGVIEKLLRVQLVDENEEEEDLDLLEEMRHQQLETQELSGESSEMFEEEETQREAPKQQPYVREYDKVGRNDPCPCGSGKKYKKCHLPLQKDSGDGDSIIT